MVDQRWEQPAITQQSTLEYIGDVAEKMTSVSSMLDSILTWALQEGMTDKKRMELRGILADLSAEERKENRGTPYSEGTVHAVHIISVAVNEFSRFLENANVAFITDYEVEHGGDS
jgi:hypothetical protein